jgi:Na+-transporting NADH:ubiquinone oxidoreductase subunit NqrF
MANAIAASGSKREAYFFLGVRNRAEHIHKEELEKLAAANENIVARRLQQVRARTM